MRFQVGQSARWQNAGDGPPRRTIATRPHRAGQRLCGQLRAQIAEGALAGGAPLPSTRALAADLGLSRTTVTAAYEQLAAEGYLVTAPGRVARVAYAAHRSTGLGAVAPSLGPHGSRHRARPVAPTARKVPRTALARPLSRPDSPMIE